MERKEVSLHQVKVYEFVREHGGWVTSHDCERRRNCGSHSAGLRPWSRKARTIRSSASLPRSSLSGIRVR
jgi:hypothetical protein